MHSVGSPFEPASHLQSTICGPHKTPRRGKEWKVSEGILRANEQRDCREKLGFVSTEIRLNWLRYNRMRG